MTDVHAIKFKIYFAKAIHEAESIWINFIKDHGLSSKTTILRTENQCMIDVIFRDVNIFKQN